MLHDPVRSTCTLMSYNCIYFIYALIFNPSMKKIHFVNDMTLGILDEDHTLINPLKHILSTYYTSNIDFCGYTIPHPSENKVHLVVQFIKEDDQTVENIISKVEEGIEGFKNIIKKIDEEFDKSLSRK